MFQILIQLFGTVVFLNVLQEQLSRLIDLIISIVLQLEHFSHPICDYSQELTAVPLGRSHTSVQPHTSL